VSVSMREPSLPEVAEDVAELKHEVRRLADRLDAAPFVRADLHSEQIGSLKASVAGLETRVNLVLGLLTTSIIGAIVVLVISAGRGGG
jgi:hypothetical protein